jgi:nucleoside-diphosphate-sugar epimerase
VRALVTGAAGFIGSHLSEALLDRGDEVLGVDRLSDYYDPSLKRRNLESLLERDGFRIDEVDLTEADLEALLEGVDVVFHLAGQPGVRVSWGDEFQLYLSDNVLATQRLLEAAKGAHLGRFVLASSSSIYGDADSFPTPESAKPAPVSPYGMTKLAAEHLCNIYAKGFGVPATSLRYFTIFGPRQRPDMAFNRFIAAALTDQPIELFGDGEQRRDFTYVADAVAATMAAGERGEPGAVYNIAGGNSATVNEVIATIGELAGGDLAVNRGDAVIGDARRTGADTTLARERLGYEPAVPLREGLERQLEFQREA